MATRTRFSSKSQEQGSTSSIEDVVSYSKEDLNNAYEAFVTEDPKDSNLSMFNIASVFGVFMLIMSAVYFMQIIGIQFGPNLSTFMEGLPIFGGIFVAITGLGFILREHPKRKKKRDQFQFSASSSGSSSSFTPSSQKSSTSIKNRKSKSSSLEDTWSSYKNRNQSKESTASSSTASTLQYGKDEYDEYALKQSKKLFKSRKDKKFTGVCGGIAKYLGVSSTVVRLIFVLSTLFFPVFNGLPLILYIVLAVVLNKEPRILEDN